MLHAGSAALNATWMDAQLASGPVTPRHGQPVEIAALWCALLLHLGELYGGDWTARAARAGDAFVRRFWRADAQCLHDVIGDQGPDAAVRPNMVIAAALPRSPLRQEHRRAVVARADAELRTPRGLRTLSPRDPDYRGRYEGDVRSRDAAYHQGTVWPWLLGFYAEAYVRAHGRGAASKRHVRELLDAFGPHLDERSLGQVSEVFDGDPPHRPGGAWAQAWSVAELLRAWALVE
jgi:predicted glycogen debranching enzyme